MNNLPPNVGIVDGVVLTWVLLDEFPDVGRLGVTVTLGPSPNVVGEIGVGAGSTITVGAGDTLKDDFSGETGERELGSSPPSLLPPLSPSVQVLLPGVQDVPSGQP